MRAAEEIVCRCCRVRVCDVERAVEQGARTLEDVRCMTGAGDACTKCRNTVQRVLSDMLAAKDRT